MKTKIEIKSGFPDIHASTSLEFEEGGNCYVMQDERRTEVEHCILLDENGAVELMQALAKFAKVSL